jgi:hypothetical protein
VIGSTGSHSSSSATPFFIVTLRNSEQLVFICNEVFSGTLPFALVRSPRLLSH